MCLYKPCDSLGRGSAAGGAQVQHGEAGHGGGDPDLLVGHEHLAAGPRQPDPGGCGQPRLAPTQRAGASRRAAGPALYLAATLCTSVVVPAPAAVAALDATLLELNGLVVDVKNEWSDARRWGADALRRELGRYLVLHKYVGIEAELQRFRGTYAHKRAMAATLCQPARENGDR